MGDPGPLHEIAAAIDDASPPAIAAAIARRVTDGQLLPGERLPTVRELAAALAVSPATVSAAWQALSRAGVIESRGRAGSFVRAPRREWLSPRVQGMGGHATAPRLDLSLGMPDPALLPPVGAFFAQMGARAETGSYHDQPVLPELETVLRAAWPVPVERMTVLDGAMDGVERTLELALRFGDRVLLESPGFPYFFDLADALGVQAIPVALDEHGMLPAALARALASRPSALVLQPRAHNPTGASMTAERARELADVIRASRDGDRLLVIEDDHSGLISSRPDVTLATWLPAQVVHVRSFSKSHGPDLRIGALGGPAGIVDRVVARRMLGPGWTSRLVQSVLRELLTDSVAVAAVRDARDAYRVRQERLRAALARRGVAVAPADGINMWMPVRSERDAAVRLAADGIAVADGSPFLADRSATEAQFVRVTAGLVGSDVETVAGALADAAGGDPRRAES